MGGTARVDQGLLIYDFGNAPVVLRFADVGNVNYDWTMPDDDRVQFSTSSPAEKTLEIVNHGAGTFSLVVQGTVSAEGTLLTSDRRLKRSISTLEQPLSKLRRLRGVSYAWRREDGARHLGFVAQEVADVVPEAVTVGPDGVYRMSYSDIVPVVVEAMKEQQRIIDDYDQRLRTLERELSAIRQGLPRSGAAPCR